MAHRRVTPTLSGPPGRCASSRKGTVLWRTARPGWSTARTRTPFGRMKISMIRVNRTGYPQRPVLSTSGIGADAPCRAHIQTRCVRSALATVAAQQRGVFTRRQALLCYSRREIEHRLATQQWLRAFRGVYVTTTSQLDLPARAHAAWLATGMRAVIGLTSAAALHGFGVLDDQDIRMVTPRGSDGLNQPGLLVTTANLTRDDIVLVRGIPCTSPVRTAVDLARLRSRLDAIAVLDAAIRSGQATPGAVMEELDRHAGLRGVVQARQLAPLADPRAESPMESRLRLILHEAGLPRPTPQLWVPDDSDCLRYRLDLGWEREQVGAEYDGECHLDRRQLRHDRERHNWLAARGWQLRYFTDRDVFQRPADIAALMRLALGLRVAAA